MAAARFTEDVDFVAVGGHSGCTDRYTPQKWKSITSIRPARTSYITKAAFRLILWKDEHADDIVQHANEVELAGRTSASIEPHDLIAMKLRAPAIER